MNPDEYQGIAMVPGYRPPRPPWRKPKWPKYVWPPVLLLGSIGALLAGAEWVLSYRPIIVPRIARATDYKPMAVTRLRADNDEIVAEIASARRRLVPPDKMPGALATMVVAQRESQYLTRPLLGRADLLRAFAARLRGQPETPPLTVQLVRRLAETPTDGSAVRFLQEWLCAIDLERHLTREQLLQIYLNEVPFGAGVFGVEEGARATFGRSLRQLDEQQLRALAALANRTEGTASLAPPAVVESSGCGRLAAHKLAERYEPAVLSRLGAEVVTSCDPALTRAIEAVIARAHLEQSGLRAAAVVVRLPGQEVAAVVGDASTPRAIGGMRAPLVIGAALASLKWSMISPLEPEGPPLRVVAMRSPVEAADGLVSAGLSVPAVIDLGVRAGIASPLEAEALTKGTAKVTPLELALALAAFAEGGKHRLPQLLRTIDGVAESDGAKAATQVMTPEVAYLTVSLMQPTRAATAARPARAPSKVVAGSASAWTGLFSPQAVVLVWVGLPEGETPTDGAQAERVAATVGHEMVAAAVRGQSGNQFPRPRGLISRKVDRSGHLLPPTASGGVEEWFVPGSVPRDEPADPEPRPPAPTEE